MRESDYMIFEIPLILKNSVGNGKEVRVRFKGFPSRQLLEGPCPWQLRIEDSRAGPRVRSQVLEVGGCCTDSVPADRATVAASGQNSDAELRVSPLQ